MNTTKLWNSKKIVSKLLPYLVLILFAGIAYLPFIFRLGFYRDDWYYVVDGFFGKPSIFHLMFWIDRPARGYLFEWLFRFFGTNATAYLLLLFFGRACAALFSFGLIQRIWPDNPKRNLWISLLFVLFPGFLWWVSGIEYQPMVMSLALHIASIYFSIRVIGSERRWQKAIFFIFALISGWGSLWLVDYAIGMEVFRLVCIYFYFQARGSEDRAGRIWKRTLLNWGLFLPVSAVFLLWRLFIFNNLRSETNISLQVGTLFTSPIQTIASWFINLLRSVWNISFRAWFAPFNANYFQLDKLSQGLLLLVAVIVAFGVYQLLRLLGKTSQEEVNKQSPAQWGKTVLIGGLIGIVGCSLPIVMMNRVVVIEDFSHYALPASLCAALVVVGFVSYIRSSQMRALLLSILVALSVLSVQSHAINVIKEEEKITDFWVQFSQRVPDLQKGTSLLINFPSISYGEETDIVWAPANLIYLDREDVITTDGLLQYPYSAVKINSETLQLLTNGLPRSETYRSHTTNIDYSKLLVVSQPTLDSCVHVIDSRWPGLSLNDSDIILTAATHSNIEDVLPASVSHTPMPSVFGASSTENWCYFYEKAALSAQMENWNDVLALLSSARQLGYQPKDGIEWMPFLQAALLTGDESLVKEIAASFSDKAFLKNQGCHLVQAMKENGYTLDPNMEKLGTDLFCGVIE